MEELSEEEKTRQAKIDSLFAFCLDNALEAKVLETAEMLGVSQDLLNAAARSYIEVKPEAFKKLNLGRNALAFMKLGTSPKVVEELIAACIAAGDIKTAVEAARLVERHLTAGEIEKIQLALSEDAKKMRELFGKLVKIDSGIQSCANKVEAMADRFEKK